MRIEFIPHIFNNNKKVTFKAHPEYKKLAQEYEINASSFFRRGRSYGSPSNEFGDVINILNKIFGIKSFDKKNMFIAGIGDSQEPFSLLAVIKFLIKDKPLQDSLNLNIADLQSKPKDKILFEQSYFDCGFPPPYVKNSFIKDCGEKYGLQYYKKYRVTDEIFEFLKQTYNDSKKSYWDTRVQDIAKEMNNEQYDIVSINNTLGYINDQNIIIETLNNIKRIVKRGGIFITDPHCKLYDETLKDTMSKEYEGIYKKY